MNAKRRTIKDERVLAIQAKAAATRAKPLLHDFFKPLPRLVVIGNSHTAAVTSAQGHSTENDRYDVFEVYHFRKAKGNVEIGNIWHEDFMTLASELTEDDYIFSTVSGNQYAMLSTVQNPIDFHVLADPDDREIPSDEAAIVPHRAFDMALRGGVRGSLAEFFIELKKVTKANIVHLSSPPPKQDNDFIRNHFENHFLSLGLEDLGPSRPSLRLTAWKMQTRQVRRYCNKYGVTYLAPPRRALTKEGFLDPRYYAKDATHANRRYGKDLMGLILQYVHAKLGNTKANLADFAMTGRLVTQKQEKSRATAAEDTSANG